MAKQHTFKQEDITSESGSFFTQEARWQRFKRVCDELGYSIRVTGGAFLTHEIDGSKEDFETILELCK
jgi:hypothetical protein